MADTQNEAIPMGGSTADGTSVTTQVAPQTSETTPVYAAGAITEPDGSEPPRKKTNIAVVLILGLFGLLVVAAILLGIVFLFATTDTMPKAPVVTGDMQSVVKESAIEMIKDKKISFNSNDVNIFLGQAADSAKDKLAEEDIQINDLFAVINNDKATLYSRVNYKGITLPIKATADVSFDDPYIIIHLHSAYVGKLSLPQQEILKHLEGVTSVENVTFRNGMIYFDTTNFNDQMTDLALSELGLKPEDVGADTDNDTDSTEGNKGFSIKKWFSNLVGGVKNTVKNWMAQKVSSLIHDVHFEDVKILDDQLVIDVTFNEEAPAEETTTDAAA